MKPFGGRLSRLALAILVTSLILIPGEGEAAAGRLGTNLGEVSYYQGTVPFNDIVRQSGEWISQRTGGEWGEGEPLALRSDGWPARLLPDQYATLPLAELSYPSGRYRVSWKGSGRFTIAGKSFSGGNRRGFVDLDGTSLVLLEVRSTRRRDPLRDVRVIVPGGSARRPFRAAYLRSLAPYSVVRFMDWQRTNAAYDQTTRSFTCGNRSRPGYYSQGTGRGASVELMVNLANSLRVAPWFTIPHDATDGWLRCHSRIVAKRLRRGLVPRYEFSNETWNPTFLQFHELSDAGQTHGLGGGDTFLGLQQEVARRHRQAMRIVKSVFGKRRFIRVIAGQAANSWVAEQRIEFESTAASVDEIAIAPYIGVPGRNPFDSVEATAISQWSPDVLFAQLESAIDSEVEPWIRDHLALASRRGKRLVAYEGGQHLAGDSENEPLTDLFVGANRDQRMGTLYSAYLARWKSLTSNSLFVHFTDSGPWGRYGSWGAIESPDALPLSASAKYAALRAYASSP